MGQVDSQAISQAVSEDARTRVFLSYSRKDAGLVGRVADGLMEAGFLADYDQAAHDPGNVSAGISAEDEWWKRLQEMIASADVMVFLVSPDSAQSAVCDEEIAYARALGKRIIAVLARAVDFARAPPRLSALNVRIDFSEDGPGFEAALAELVSALQMNVGWHRDGRKYYARVQEWDTAGRPKSRLLREGAVEEAERWALARPRNEPEPGAFFLAWIEASRAQIKRDAAVRAFWRRVTAVFVLTTLLATVAGAWFVVNGQRNLGRSESLMLARTADQFYNAGDHLRALQLAILASRETFLSPSTHEAKAAFAKSAQALKHVVSIRQTFPDGDGTDAVIARTFIGQGGERLVTTNFEDSLFVWDLATGAQLGETMKLNAERGSLALETAPEGAHVVLWNMEGAHVVALADGTRLHGVLGVEAGEEALNMTALALSADGRRVATGVNRGKARTYDVATGRKLAEFPARPEGTPSVRLSADGRVVLVVRNRQAFLADAETGEITGGPFEPAPGLRGYVDGFLSPDASRVLLTHLEGGIELWNGETGALITPALGTPDGAERVEFMTSRRRIVTVSSSGITTIWDADTGAPVGEAIQTQGWSGFLELKPEDETFLTRTYLGGLQLWDVETGEGLLPVTEEEPKWTGTLRVPGTDEFLAWDGRQVARFYTSNGAQDAVPVIYEHPGFIETLNVSPDGRLLLTWTSESEARLWDLQMERQLLGPLPHGNAAEPPRFLGDGSTFLTLDGASAHVWSALPESHVPYTGDVDLGPPVGGKLSPDGSRQLYWNGSGRAVLRKAETGAQVGREILLGDAGDWDAEFDAESPFLAIWFEGVVQLLDTATGESRDGFLEHESWVVDARFALGGRRLVTRDEARTITIWDTETLQQVGEAMAGELYEMPPVDPVRGRMVLLTDGQGQLIDLETGAAIGEPMRVPLDPSGEAPEGHDNYPLFGAFSPDGMRVAVWSMYHAGLWSAADGAPLGPVIEPGGVLYHVYFGAPDGQVALSFDRAVRLADLESGAMTGVELPHPDVPGQVVFSPDGRQVVTLADDWQLRFWDAETGALQESPVTVALSEHDLTFSADGTRLLAIDPTGILRLIDTATVSELFVWSGLFSTGDAVWQPDRQRVLVSQHDGRLVVVDLSDALRTAATPEDVTAVCAAKLAAMPSVRGAPFVREIDAEATFAAPILRGREGEDVCTPPPAAWWETAAGVVFGWAFR